MIWLEQITNIISAKNIKQCFVLIIAIAMSSVTYSNPVLNNVSSGNATVTQSSNTTTVNQSSQQAILNWNSFNIGANQKTQFIQPNSSSVALNRINPNQGASQIYGQLTANGQIILINGAGIHFGPNAQVNVGSLIASTSDITNSNFLAGKYIFNIPSQFNGSIVNEGKIIAANYGLVALLGDSVSNTGIIKARLGSIALGSGSEFTLDLYGDQLINFSIGAPSSTASTGVVNSGKLLADGGQILVTAQAAAGVLDNVIDMQGVAETKSVSKLNGEIILSGGDNGTVAVSGDLNASGSGSNSTGGTIEVTGNNIDVTSTANLNASGTLGGGEILVGGNEHGAGPEQNALTTTIDVGALISANALSQGNGGKIIIWSNNATNFQGSISATGGSTGGNGGFVEVSGQQLLNFNGGINLSAAQGVTGTLLLDPENLTIQTAGPSTATNSGTTYTSNSDNSILTVSALEAALSNANVLLQTGSGGEQVGDITVANSVTWNNLNTLTLSAFHNINIDAAITNSSGGSLILKADNTGTGIGTITFAGATPQINMSGGGTVDFYYNPTSFPTPTNFSNNVSVSDGTTFTPYMLVNNLTNLQNINSNLDGDYALGTNINMSGNFTPIGSIATPFTGQFNGQDYTINNYFSTQNGLFGATSSTSTIENIGITNATLTLTNVSTGSYGLLIGDNYGTINNAYSSGSISNSDSGGNEIFGGLVGLNNGSINTSNSSATISNNDSNGSEIFGGLGGQNNDSITTSYSTGNVSNNNASGGFEIFGGLVGQNNTSINTSYSTGNVSNSDSGGFELFGGLVGQNNDSINTSYNMGNVSNSDSGGGFETFGGLAGQNNVSIDTAYNMGNISNSDSVGFESFGGIVGQNFGSISTTYNTGIISNSDHGGFESFGGLVGQNFTTISVGYNTGNVSNVDSGGGSEAFGGLVGINYGDIDSVYSTGSISNTDTNGSESFGGLAGLNYSNISNAYSTGSVTNNDNGYGQETLGGLVGSNTSSLTDVYSTGTVSNNNNGGENIGGLTGLNSGQVINSFWDVDTSGLTTSSSGTGETTAQMMLPSTFNFDFTNTWGIISGDGINPNGSYPYLLAFFTPAPRVISGFIPGGSMSATGLAGISVMLGVGGNNIDSVTTGSDGFYYFLEKNNTITDNTPFITYLSGSGTESNVVSDAPANGGSLTMLNMTSNSIQVGGGTENLAGVLTVDPAITISNSDLGTAAIGLPSNDILYSVSGSNLTLGNSTNVNTTLQTDALGSANTTYNVNGTISSNALSIDTLNFYGPVTINASSVSTTGSQTYHSTVTVDTDTVLNSQNGSLTLATVDGGSSAISLLAGNGSITLNGAISTTSNELNALVLVDGASFINNAGSDALSALNSRFLIYSVNPENDTLDGLAANKYYDTSYAVNAPSSLSDQTDNFTFYSIAPVLTITANNVSSIYGTNPTLTYSVTGFIDGDTSSVLSGNADLTLPALIADLHVTGSPYTITASNGSLISLDNYGLTFVNGQLTVTPASLTVSALGQNKVYDGTTTATATLSNNSLASDNVSVSYNSANFTNGNVGTNINILVSGISISGANSADYTLQNVTASTTANITPATLTYTANTGTMTYGSSVPTLSGTVTGFVNNQTLASATTGSSSFTSTATSSSNVGNYAVNGSGLTANNGNYVFTEAASNATALTINPATLTYTANAGTMTYGSSVPPLSGTVTGFVNSDTLASATTGSSSFTSTATSSSNVGNYAINGSGLTANNGNYVFTEAASNATALTINPATLTYTANAGTMTYGSSVPSLSGTVTGFVNSDTLASATTGSSSFTSTATSSSNVGNYAINGSGLTANNGNYVFTEAASNATALTINPATLTYTANAGTMTYGSSVPPLSGTVTGFVNSDTLASATTGSSSFTSTATSSSNVGNYAINGSGLTANNGNYVFTEAASNATALTISPATLTYTANTGTMTYGSSVPPLSGTVTGFVNNQTLASATTGSSSFTSTATSSSNVGNYAINGSGLIANNGNYVFTEAASNATALTINPATLTYTANTGTMTYGSSVPPLSGTVTGFVNSDTLASATTGSSSFTSTATSSSNVGNYAINGSGLTANNGNYIFTEAASNATALSILQAQLTITANNQSKVYGAALPPLTASYTGFVNGNTSASLTTQVSLSTTATASSSVTGGPYVITASGASDSNYNITYLTGKLVVTPATLTVTANTQNISFGQTYSTTAVSYSGFVNGDTVTSLTAPATVSANPSSDGQFHATNPPTSTSPASTSPFAPYTLTPSSGTDSNYNISYVTGSLFVSPVTINFNVPTGTNSVTVNMSSGTPVTISGHSNLATEQLQFDVNGILSSTSSFLVSDISEATITSHATNATLGTLAGLQIAATGTTTSHTLTLSQNIPGTNNDSTNILTPDSTLVPIVFGDPTTTLTIDGNGKNNVININSINANFNGTLTANTQGGTSDVINFNGLNGATPNTISLTASTIDLNANINLPNSTLDLTAASAALNSASITSTGSSTGVIASIDVDNFDLIQGGWYQDNSTLPTFTVLKNFQLTGIPNSAVQFIRAQSGTGTSTNPFVLTDIYGIEGIGSNIKTLGYDYLLANNVNATVTSLWNNGIGFIAIGNNTNNFIGSLNGQNFTVSNLTVNNSGSTVASNPAGLFGVTDNSSISNISVSGNFTGDTDVGALIGKATNTTISNANVLAGSTVTLFSADTTNPDVGGLIGLNVGGSLSSVNSNATVLGMTRASNIGGLIGYNSGTINFAISAGSVSDSTGTTDNYIGGFIGVNTGSVSNSSSSVTLNAANSSSNSNIAGFISDNSGAISISSSSSTVIAGNSSKDADLAGFVAINTGTINTSTNTGTVTAGTSSDEANIAGFVADNYGSISNSSNQGAVTLGNYGSYGFIGGLVAENDIVINGNTVTSLSTITNSFNSGAIVGGNYTNHASIGGLVAMNYGNITNSSNQGGIISGNNNSTAAGDLAGLVADNSATVVNGNLVGGNISNSFNTGAVSGDNNSSEGNMGGLIAVNNGGTITNSYNSGTVTGGTSSTFGDLAGLVADNFGITVNGSGGNGGGCMGMGMSGSSSTVTGGTITGSYNTGAISGGNLSSQGNIAGLVAVNSSGTITSSYNAGAVSGGNGAISGSTITYATNGNLAGLVAINSGNITSSYNTSAGTVTGGNYASHGDLAGLVADNTSTISNSYNLGAVTGGNYSTHGNLGGLVATNSASGSITSSYSTAVVTGGSNSTQANIGGLVGDNAGTITSSTNNGTVVGGSNSQQVYIGGLVGYNSGTISKSYNYGVVNAGNNISQLDIGGLVGFNSGLISNSINYANIFKGLSNTSVNISGIAGLNQGRIVNSSSTGTVSNN